MGRLIDGYAEGLIDKADFEPRVTGLRQRIKGWEEQAEALRDEAAQRVALSLIVSRLEDFAGQVRDRLSAVDWSLQRDLIRLLVKRVEIDRGDITVVFRVAPPPDPGYGGSNEDSLHHCRWGTLTLAGQSVHAPVCAGMEEARAGVQPRQSHRDLCGRPRDSVQEG
jgi:site-specific DNA recombinase